MIRTASQIVLVCLLVLSGCTEMRADGEAKVFQSSATGTVLRTLLGIGLVVVGALALVGSMAPDRKPRHRRARADEKLSTLQRVCLAGFGAAMGLMGLVLAGMAVLSPGKLHVTVYPDRVAMASTYSQTGGRETVIPFASLASVDLRDEPNPVVRRKNRSVLVFTLTNGKTVWQEAGNNERQALDTIRQALADYQAKHPSGGALPEVATGVAPPDPIASASAPSPAAGIERSRELPGTVGDGSTSVQPPRQYELKRYPITIPVPAGQTVVAPETVVQAGTKLQACSAGSWWTVTVVTTNDDGTITCNWDSFPSFTYRMLREDLTIASPGAPGSRGESPSQQYRLKRYPIRIAVPATHAIVAADTVVTPGMKLGACYAGGWESVTVVAVNDDGTITCNWDKYQAFTYRMMREDLIIPRR